jgi:hypothetical protein
MTTQTKIVLLVGFVAGACAPATSRFPLRAPLWSDPDRNAVASKPAKRYSGLIADGADQMLFRRVSDSLAFRHPGESANVNSLDEVPSSSWFENRIGLLPMTPEQVGQGACGDTPGLDPTRGPWKVTAAKPDGANPGFFVTAPDGRRYLLKFDGHIQPERATAADVVGSKLYHALGYFTPCNQIVYFPESILAVDRAATRKNDVGEDVPLSRRDVETVLAAAIRRPDGTLRASASMFVPGTPMGPFRYEGLRADDPNDVIPHQDRRELRAARLFAAWTNHFDAREQNSLDVWVKDGGRQYLRHYIIDWGDTMGSIWDKEEISRRLGHSGYFDFDHVAVDLVTLGLVSRPWREAQVTSHYQTFGYFSSRNFVGSQWRGGYPNPAFDRMTTRDAQWAVRSLARMSDDHVRAAVAAARFSDPVDEQYLLQTMLERRDRILGEYLTQQSPLTRFMLVRRIPGKLEQSLCFEDDAVRTGVADPATTRYRIRALGGAEQNEVLGTLQFRADPDHANRSCIRLPLGAKRPQDLAGEAAPDTDPLRYQVFEIATDQRPGASAHATIRVHLYDLGPARGYQLVGIERSGSGKGNV